MPLVDLMEWVRAAVFTEAEVVSMVAAAGTMAGTGEAGATNGMVGDGGITAGTMAGTMGGATVTDAASGMDTVGFGCADD